MSKNKGVPRPSRRSEWRLEFHTREAEQGWRDFLATARNATVAAWEALTNSPWARSGRQYPLKGDYAHVTWAAHTYERWQYKVTDGGRIWYFVVPDPEGKSAGIVRLERCTTGHPKETE